MSSDSVSTQKTISTSSDILDKDELIDDLNAQLGNFLTVKQELCAIKNENELMKKSMIASETQFKTERQQNLHKIDQLSQEIVSLKETIEILTNENEQKNELINNLMEESRKNKEEIAASKENSEVEIDKQVNLQTASLTTALEEKKTQIQELKCEISEIRSELKMQIETISEKKIEIQRLTLENEKLNNEKNSALNEITQLKLQIKDCQTQISYIQSDKENLGHKNDELTKQISSLSDQISKFNSENDSLRAQLGEYDEKFSYLQQLFPDSNNLTESIETLQQDSVKLINQVKKDHAKIKACKSFLIEQQDLLEKKDNEISDLTNKLNEQLNKNEEISSKNNELNTRNTALTHRSNNLDQRYKYTAAIIRANTNLSKQINQLRKLILPDTTFPSLRNTILAVIFARRWISCKDDESPRAKVDDSRNWWWVSTEKTSSQNDIISYVESMKDQIKSSNEQIDNLKKLLIESQNTVKEANNAIEAKEKQISNEQNKSQDHLNQIKLYEAKLAETVPKTQYEALQKKFSTQGNKLLEAIKALQENETIVNKLRSKLQISEENREKNGINASAMVIEVKRLKQQLKEANIEIEVLNQALNGKRKDILSLERGIVNEKRSKAALKVQCYSLAAENQNLTNVVLNQDSIPEQKKIEDVTLQVRLKEMSRNLAGTMFN